MAPSRWTSYSALLYRPTTALHLIPLNSTPTYICVYPSGGSKIPNGIRWKGARTRRAWICTLASEIVRTVLMSAIKNHCWLWITISRWKKIEHYKKNNWKAYEIPRLVMLNKYFFNLLKIIQHVRSWKKIQDILKLSTSTFSLT